MQHHSLIPAASRRGFLKHAGLGCGSIALTSFLHQQGIVQAEEAEASNNPLAVRQPHFAAKAKA